MMAAMRTSALFFCMGLMVPLSAFGQASCPVQSPAPLTSADRAYRARKYDEAESLFRAQIASASDSKSRAIATAGLIHTLVTARKTQESLKEASVSEAAFPKDAVVMEAVGYARFRHGETNAAAIAWNAAMHADPCNARVHYDVASYLRLNGMFASEEKQLDIARQLDPKNKNVALAYKVTTSAPLSMEERINRLKKRLETPGLSSDQRSSIQRAIAVAEVAGKGSCELVNPVPSTKIPIFAIMNGPDRIKALGVQMTLNGKKKRFEIDSGASGILISRSAAASAGLTAEAKSQNGGIGDEGPASISLAHVDDIHIGGMEFRNCMVRYFDKNDVLGDIDGLIGPDVFSQYLVTLDFASREMRLDPLPKRPGDSSTELRELDTAGQSSDADLTPHDRYIAPEMQDWTKVFRYGHYLLFPTHLNNGPSLLFLMDTGANRSMISPEAARTITSVSTDEDHHVKGISGEVANVMEADNVTLEFAKVRVNVQHMSSYNTFGTAGGVAISGIIGFDALRELVLSIDYRDNLVHVVYDPKARHAH